MTNDEKKAEQQATTKAQQALDVADQLSESAQEWYQLLTTPSTATTTTTTTATTMENPITKSYWGIPGYIWGLGAAAVAWIATRR